jgi:CRISPR-associated protein Cas2
VGGLRLFTLVCFDIVEDPVRARVVKVLKGYGQRVQKSVFECARLREGQFVKMKTRIEELVDQSQDSVRYYRVCQACLGKMEYTGIGETPDTREYRVV